MPLPGRLAGTGEAFVVQWPGATSVSPGPSAGTSEAVNFFRASMHGVIDTDIDSPAAELHASHSEDVVEQPASSMSPPAMALIEAKDLKVIGYCGLVP